jgi:hypothetical protein
LRKTPTPRIVSSPWSRLLFDQGYAAPKVRQMDDLAKEDLSFFVGKNLSLFSISMHQIILVFDDHLSVNCESRIAHINHLNMRDEFEFFGNAGSVIGQLFEKTVEEASGNSDGTLVLKFSNNTTIEFLKKDYIDGFYESYVIEYKDKMIVI